jgi:hypothetical protein
VRILLPWHLGPVATIDEKYPLRFHDRCKQSILTRFWNRLSRALRLNLLVAYERSSEISSAE